jgi:hypothetical protein
MIEYKEKEKKLPTVRALGFLVGSPLILETA